MPTSLLRVPVSLLESFCWSVITYWVVGLSAQAGRHVIHNHMLTAMTITHLCKQHALNQSFPHAQQKQFAASKV